MQFIDTSNGAVTFMDGRFTLQQVLMGVVGIVIFLLLFKCLKKAFKLCAVVVLVCWFGVSHGFLSPTQLKDAADVISAKGIETYRQFSDLSKNIELAHGSIRIQLDGQWYDISNIMSYTSAGDGNLKVQTEDGSYEVTEQAIVDLLKSFE